MLIFWSKVEKLIANAHNNMSQKKDKLARKTKPVERDWTKERDERCIPVVMEIFKLIAGIEKAPINTDTMPKEACYKIYFDLNKQISDLISHRGVDVVTDMEFIWQAVREIVTITEKVVSDSIKKNDSILQDVIFDVKDGDAPLYTSTRLIQLLERKEQVREAINEVLNQTVDKPVEKKEN
jgi:hypothetical protein